MGREMYIFCKARHDLVVYDALEHEHSRKLMNEILTTRNMNDLHSKLSLILASKGHHRTYNKPPAEVFVPDYLKTLEKAVSMSDDTLMTGYQLHILENFHHDYRIALEKLNTNPILSKNQRKKLRELLQIYPDSSSFNRQYDIQLFPEHTLYLHRAPHIHMYLTQHLPTTHSDSVLFELSRELLSSLKNKLEDAISVFTDGSLSEEQKILSLDTILPCPEGYFESSRFNDGYYAHNIKTLEYLNQLLTEIDFKNQMIFYSSY